ncbi:unnamed protein product [Ixodes persulcatus]
MFMTLAVAALLALQATVETPEDPKCHYAWASLGTSGGDLHIHDDKPSQGAVAWGSFQNDIHLSGYGNYLHERQTLNYGNEKRRLFVNVERRMLNYDNVKQRRFENVEQQNLRFGTVKFNVNVRSERRNPTFENGKPRWFVNVHLQMKQLAGLSDHFENKTLNVSNEYLNVTRALFFNIDGDLSDLEGVLRRVPDQYSMGQTPSCSVLIKVVADNDDILFAHNTWFLYRSMLRIEKKYKFPWHLTSKSSETIPGHTISMSSYPGKLDSVDDFYLASTGLAITETSLENNNDSLWNLVRPDNAPLTWVRDMVATRLAVTGPQWVDYFGKLNSGTYNNQWMVLDYKLFTPGSAIGKNTLWILEQMPNITRTKDVSKYLQNQKYWASYNVAFLPAIFNISGQPDMVKKYGNYCSYDMSPRAQIFRRKQSKVKDVNTMSGLMRYNNYTHDPESRCNCTPPYNPIYSIAARYDLLDPKGSYDLPKMVRRADGATDMKLTNNAMFKRLEFIAISGPTFHPDGSVLPPFQWSTSGFQDLHDGHPDKWMFGPTYHRWGSCPNL